MRFEPPFLQGFLAEGYAAVVPALAVGDLAGPYQLSKIGGLDLEEFAGFLESEDCHSRIQMSSIAELNALAILYAVLREGRGDLLLARRLI